MSQQVAASAGDEELVRWLGLDRGDLLLHPRLPRYEQLFPSSWAKDSQTEVRHRGLMEKIYRWPRSKDNQYDYKMALLMRLVVCFNPDGQEWKDRRGVEALQLHYATMLQRYLRSVLGAKFGGEKFLEGMMLVSYTQELWSLGQSRAQA